MFDAIILGLGAMGSAAAYHLSRSGKKVLGIDRFAPPHSFGSSHGQTRIIREAYFEHPAYVPLVQRAYKLWRQLEHDSGQTVLVQTGAVMVGRPDGALVAGAERSARLHRLEHEMLSAAELRRRFPQLQPDDAMTGVWEPRAGVLFPETCIAAHLALARRQGAELILNAPAHWEVEGPGVKVLAAGQVFQSPQLVICAGAWANDVLPQLKLPLTVERQVMFWFAPEPWERFQLDCCPVHIWEWGRGQFFYGLPDFGHGVKVARHHQGNPAHPDTVCRQVSAGEVEEMRRIVDQFVPGAAGSLQESSVCLYANTPDGHFLIDRHPRFPQVTLVSPCSGHGFKFSSAIGEIVAGMIAGQPSAFDLSLFRYRFD